METKYAERERDVQDRKQVMQFCRNYFLFKENFLILSYLCVTVKLYLQVG